MGALNNKLFQPTRIISDMLTDDLAYQPGALYFVTDTGEMYLDLEDERIQVGGRGVSLLYGNDAEPEENGLNGTYTLKMTENCQIGDLILNVDGCFYKVLDIYLDEGTVICNKLTVQGSGGGSGGGPGGGGSSSAYKENMVVRISGINQSTTILYGQDTYATIYTSSNIDEEDTVLDTDFNIECSILESGNIVYKTTINSKHKQSVNWNYGIQLSKTNVNYTVRIRVTGATTGAVYPAFTYKNISATNLSISLSDAFNPRVPLINTNAKVIFNFVGNIEKTLKVYIDDQLIDTKTYAANKSGDIEYMLPDDLTPGRKRIKATLGLTGSTSDNLPSITFEVAIYTSDYTGTIIWFGEYKDTYYDYENIQIPFMIKNYNSDNGDTISVRHNQEVIQLIEEIVYNKNEWYYFTVPETQFTVNENNEYYLSTIETSSTLSFYVEKSEIELYTDGLRVAFNPAGRSNTEIKEKRSVWNYTNKNHQTFSGIFENFNWYNNGWMMDEEKVPILRLTNGAKFTVPIFNNTSLITYENLTFEFCLKISNITEYKKQIITAVSGAEAADAEEESLTYTYETHNGVCVSWYDYNNDGGLIIGTQQAFLKKQSDNSDVRVSYTDEEKINLSFTLTPLVGDSKNRYILSVFLNGLWSGAKLINSEVPFKSTANNLVFSSEFADLDIYGFRVYDSGLSFYEVVQNYCYDQKNPELYFQNQITKDNDKYALDLNKIIEYNNSAADKGWNVIMPYFIVDVQYDTDDDGNPTTPSDILPAKKGDNKIVRFDFYNTVLDNAYKSSQLTSKIINKYDPISIFKGEDTTELAYYLHHCPSFISIGGDLNVQGTSSQAYPRKNYKLKNKNAKTYINGGPQLQALADRKGLDIDSISLEDFSDIQETTNDDGEIEITTVDAPETATKKSRIYLDNTRYSTNKFCFKVDYMESSGSYNTGFANLIGGLNLQHPLSKYYTDSAVGLAKTKGMRTTVYGFPVLGFQRKDDGSIEYIGRYNFNLDKSSNEYYGFELDDPHPFVSGKTIADIAECWEFRDNQGFYCSFKNEHPENDPFSTLTSSENAAKGFPEIWDHFEYRYVNSLNADLIDYIVEGEKFPSKKANIEDFQTVEQRKNYLNATLHNFEILWKWVNSTDQTAVPSLEDILNNTDLQDTYKFSNNETIYGYSYDCKEYRKEKFSRELTQHLDKDYCLTYYVLTELLLCFDSRGKNMMMASFGPQQEGGDYIWFPIFYDIDTQLGLNNSGALLWDYNKDVYANKAVSYSTNNSVLWENLYDCFYADLAEKYGNIRKQLVSADFIEGWYSCNPDVTGSPAMAGARPLVALNLDEYFKYINIITSPYLEAPGKYSIDTNGQYLRDLQGNRSLARKLLIRNRMYYEDSFWGKGAFDGSATDASTMAEIRISADNVTTTSDVWTLTETGLIENNDTKLTYTESDFINTPEYQDYLALNTSDEFQITPFLDCFITIATDMVSTQNKIKTSAGTPATFSVRISKNASTDQILRFLGTAYLSSIGPIYKQYAGRADLRSGNKLKEILLGNGYRGVSYNWKNDNTPDITLPQSTILEKFDITNYTNWVNEIDLKFSSKIKTVKALGTQVPYILLNAGIPISTLQLPATTTSLNMTNFNNLTTMIDTSVLYGEDSDPEGLYIHNITNQTITNTTFEDKFTNVNIENDNLGVQTYWLVKNIIDRKGPQNLTITLKNINWSPYELVEYGSTYSSRNTYYKNNYHNQLIEYTYNDQTWNEDTLNGRIFMLKDNVENYNIRPIESIADLSSNKWQMPESEDLVDIQQITGICYINNTEAINESILGAIEQRWPGLEIYAKTVIKQYQARFIKIDDEGKETLLHMQKGQYQNFASPYEEGIIEENLIKKEHYDFIGWKLLSNGIIYTEETWNNIPWDETVYDYIFIAQYEKHPYQITFIVNGDDNNDTEVFFVPYNESIVTPDIIPTKTLPSLSTYEIYFFKGYSELNKNTLVDFSTQIAYKDTTYQPVFEKINLANLTDDELENYIQYDAFNFIESGNDFICEASTTIELSGKIIIPSTFNNKTITQIGIFKNESDRGNNTITHVFFKKDNNITSIAADAFKEMKTLVFFDFEALSHLQHIRDNAFKECPLDASIISFGDALETIGYFSFNQAFNPSTSGGTLIIPPSVREIGSYGISNNDNLVGKNWSLQIGNQSNESQLNLSTHAFRDNNIASIRQNNPFQNFIFYSANYNSFSDVVREYQGNQLTVQDMLNAGQREEDGVIKTIPLGKSQSLIY